jgi:hypothetical protein
MSRFRLRAVASCLLAIPLLVPATASAVPPTCSPASGLEAAVQAGETITLPGAPCTDPDGDAVSIEPTQELMYGFVEPAGIQPIETERTYTADPDAGGLTDTLKFRAVAGGQTSNEATLLIHISANHAPVCPGHVELEVQAGETIVFAQSACTDEDGDPLSVLLVQWPSHGAITPLSPTPPWTYTPTAGYIGRDFFTYRARDASAESNPGEVGITIIPAATGGGTPNGGGATPAVPSSTPPDLMAPTLSLRTPAAALALKRALRRGVAVTLTVGEPGRATVRLLLSRRDARRLGVDHEVKRAVTVGRLSRTLAAGDTKVAVKLTRKARRRLARVRKVKLRLEVTITDAAGNVRRVTRTVTLRRAT